MDMSEKNYAEKCLLVMFLTEGEVLMGWRHCSKNISATSLTLLIFPLGWALWSITTQVNDATAVTFSVKCLNPLQFYPLSGNIFRKWFASYFLFIHKHFIIMWSPIVNRIAVTTLLLTSGLHCCQQRIFKKNTHYFYAVRISILLAILSEMFVLLVW